MNKKTLSTITLAFVLTAWIASGHYTYAQFIKEEGRYFNLIDSADEKLGTYAEKRYQRELATAREREIIAQEQVRAGQAARDKAARQALIAGQQRVLAVRAKQERQRQEILAHNNLVAARETAIQLLAKTGADISQYPPISQKQLPTANIQSVTSQSDVATITNQRQKILAQTQRQKELEKQQSLAQQRRKAALVQAEANAKKIAQATKEKKRKKSTRRSRAS